MKIKRNEFSVLQNHKWANKICEVLCREDIYTKKKKAVSKIEKQGKQTVK